ncbi:MAG: DUF2207 domain-containing protein [Actinomycetota bacterium]|nr:DUF2207 domain-containing protein [Actinomycetota bacterium]
MLLAVDRAETAFRLGVGAVLALGAWLVLLGLLATVTRARRPDPGPESMELGGDEPPAVVNMLANGWKLGREAVPATLLDLAARKLVTIEPAGLDRFVVRTQKSPPSGARSGLTPYEEQLLLHVRSLAGPDGTIAAEALTTGPEGESDVWWKSFERSVVKDVRDRGLARNRWSNWMLLVLSAVALAPAVLAALTLVFLPADPPDEEDDVAGGFLGVTALFWFPLAGVPFMLRSERDTPAGREAAARWLGLRDHLEGSGGFTEAPPAAVVLWDRHLAYGAAMGVAPGAVRALPLGSESDTEAWSHYGGRWRMVHIDYPKRLPPGWGRPPLLATAIGLASLVGGLFVARIFFPLMADTLSELFDSPDDGFMPLDLLAVAIVGLPTAVTAVWLARSALMLAAAVPDLFVRREVQGVVLRIRRHEKHSYLAVDDGTSSKIKAWLVQPTVLGGAGLGQGSPVSATVSPRLGHVSRLEKQPEEN